jgi:putative ABC transport system substrate-binding protein
VFGTAVRFRALGRHRLAAGGHAMPDRRSSVFRPCARRAIAALALAHAAGLCAQHLVVLASGDTVPFQQATAGVHAAGLPVDVLPMTGDAEAALRAALLRAGRDGVVVTLGAGAAAIAAQAAPSVTVVSCMVPGHDPATAPAGTTIVPLEIPFDSLLTWLKRLLPEARTVGVLFDPAQNERRAAEGAAALKHAGYTPVLEPVPGPSALPAALKHLATSADVLQAIADGIVFSAEHARALLLFSFRNGIPLVGPSDAWARAGALYAVDWDYADLGRYCAATAAWQWSGGRAAAPVPARTLVSVNLRSAGQLRIRWDP